MEYSELKKYLDKKGLDIYSVSNEIGMSYDGFRLSIKNETIQLSKLKKLCEIIEINPMIFFKNNSEIQMNKQNEISFDQVIESKNREIKLLEKQILDKEEIINLLKEKNNQ